MSERTKDRELALLQEIQQRARIRKIGVLTRLRGALDLPIDEHLDAMAERVTPKTYTNGGAV